MNSVCSKNDTTINVRIPAYLKQRGDRVLKRNAVSISAALRCFYEYLDEKQELPDFIKQPEASARDRLAREQRQLLREFFSGVAATSSAGASELDGKIASAKSERLQRQLQTGVQE